MYFVASVKIDPRRILFASSKPEFARSAPTLDRPLGFYWTEGRSGVGLTDDGIPPIKVGSSIGIPSPPAVLFPDGEVLTPSLEACERLQGFPRGWITKGLQGQEQRAGWRLVGNAVSLPVASWVADQFKAPGQVQEFEEAALDESRSWPDAGWNIGKGRKAIQATSRPVARKPKSITTYRDASWSRLSDRALDGFINRASEGGLKMPEGFLDALRAAKRKSHIER